MSKTTTKTPNQQSRAVLRRVEAGSSSICAICEEAIKFAAKTQRSQVIANVYTEGKWTRVEHFHSECYSDKGEQYGPPIV
ncbi:MAG: hypothetical protein ACSLFB_05220 [Acidimicrobiales bacterium]